MMVCVVQLLLLVIAIEIGFSQDCTPPETKDLKILLEDIIGGGNSAATPNITLADFKVVCRSYGKQQDLLRAVSVVIEYICSGHDNCPVAAPALEQIDFECIRGQWSNSVLGMTANTRSTNPEASFTTTSREDCAQCIAPELAKKFSFITDSITHCRGDCGPPVVPADGDVRVFGASVAVYICNDGYYLADNSYRVCLDNGAWSGSVPACNKLVDTTSKDMMFKISTICFGMLSGILGVVLTLSLVAMMKVHKEVIIMKSRYVQRINTAPNESYAIIGNSNHISHSATNLEGGSAPETDAEYETVSTLTIPQGGSAPESDAEYATVSFHMDKRKGQTCNTGSLPNISVADGSITV